MTCSSRFRIDAHNRPPDWKWRRAGELIDERDHVTRDENAPGLAYLFAFRQRHNAARSSANRCQLRDDFPGLFEAYQIYAQPHSRPARWEIEARILAREPFAEIARKAGIDLEIVGFYEQCFFNVLDRLNEPSHVHNFIIGRPVDAGLATPREFSSLLKLCGYRLGSLAVDVLLYGFYGTDRGKAMDILAACQEAELNHGLVMKAALTMQTMPVNWQTQTEIVDFYFRKQEIDRHVGGPGPGTEAILENVRAFLERVKVTRRPSRVSGPPKTLIEQIERAGIGFRADELLRMEKGEPVPESLLAAYESARYPEQEIVTDEKAYQDGAGNGENNDHTEEDNGDGRQSAS